MTTDMSQMIHVMLEYLSFDNYLNLILLVQTKCKQLTWWLHKGKQYDSPLSFKLVHLKTVS